MTLFSKDEISVLVPGGAVGYGFDKDIFWRGVKRRPDVIAYDAGTIDPGPFYLGEGIPFVPTVAAKIDIEICVEAALSAKIPLVFTTAGGSGADVHVKKMLAIVREILDENGWRAKVATIGAEIGEKYLKEKALAGQTSPLGPTYELTEKEIGRSEHIVAQMGYEPLIRAFDADPDIILAGRCCDEMGGASLPIMRGFDKGLSLHMGKILECGSQCIERARGRRSSVFGILRKDHFFIEPADPESRATVESVTKHCAYEERHPCYIAGPGGAIDARESTFEQYDSRVVKVSGSRFDESDRYRVKLEGAAFVGYRTIIVGGTRSQEMIDCIDDCLSDTFDKTVEHFRDISRDDYQVHFHVYGKDGILGDREPVQETTSHELGIVSEVVASTKDIADAVCHFIAGTRLHHMDYPRSLNRSCGNMAFISSPLEFHNKAYEFNIHHLMTVDDPNENFPVTTTIFN